LGAVDVDGSTWVKDAACTSFGLVYWLDLAFEYLIHVLIGA
jgi:hypothetical protein